MSEILINGKKFGLTKAGENYALTGQRGARYVTMRNKKNPQIMFLVNLRGFGIPAGFENVYLSDADGELKVVDVLWVRS